MLLTVLVSKTYAAPAERGNDSISSAGNYIFPMQPSVDSAFAILAGTSENLDGKSPREILEEKARAHIKIGDLYYRHGLYTNAFNAFANALRIAEENEFNSMLGCIYNDIGKIYCTWSDFTTGLSYFEKSLEYCSPDKDTSTYRSLLINLQGAYIHLHDIPHARSYYDKMCALSSQNGITRYFRETNRGLLEMERGDSLSAIPYFRKAAAIAGAEDLGPSVLASAFDYTADAYSATAPDSAIFYWNSAVAIPDIPPILRLGIFKKLSYIHKSRKERDKAVYYGNRYMMLSDSIFKMEEINRIKDIQAVYENGKKLRRINELSEEKERQQIMISNQRRVIAITITSFVIFLGMTFVLFIQKRRLRQTYLHLFLSDKEVMESQKRSEEREKELKQEIARMKTSLESVETTADTLAADDTKPQEPAAETRLQSVDRLTEEKRKEILAAVDNVLSNETYICDPDFSIKNVADITGYNSRYVSQIINDEYGCNFRTKLNECRMKIAKRRILDVENYGQLTIQAIAESVGYRSQSGFVQIFKKATGFTPSMFQKLALSQNKA